MRTLMDVTTPGLCEADLERERQIAAECAMMVCGRTPEIRLKAMEYMKRAIAARSPAAILAMERAQGLVPHV